MNNNLSEHDKAIVAKIEQLQDQWGWTRWPDMSALAEDLEDEKEKARWGRVCKNMCLYERGRAGDL